MKWQPLAKNIVKGVHRNVNCITEFVKIECVIWIYKFSQIEAAKETAAACRKGFFRFITVKAFYPLLLEISFILKRSRRKTF